MDNPGMSYQGFTAAAAVQQDELDFPMTGIEDFVLNDNMMGLDDIGLDNMMGIEDFGLDNNMMGGLFAPAQQPMGQALNLYQPAQGSLLPANNFVQPGQSFQGMANLAVPNWCAQNLGLGNLAGSMLDPADWLNTPAVGQAAPITDPEGMAWANYPGAVGGMQVPNFNPAPLAGFVFPSPAASIVPSLAGLCANLSAAPFASPTAAPDMVVPDMAAWEMAAPVAPAPEPAPAIVLPGGLDPAKLRTCNRNRNCKDKIVRGVQMLAQCARVLTLLGFKTQGSAQAGEWAERNALVGFECREVEALMAEARAKMLAGDDAAAQDIVRKAQAKATEFLSKQDEKVRSGGKRKATHRNGRGPSRSKSPTASAPTTAAVTSPATSPAPTAAPAPAPAPIAAAGLATCPQAELAPGLDCAPAKESNSLPDAGQSAQDPALFDPSPEENMFRWDPAAHESRNDAAADTAAPDDDAWPEDQDEWFRRFEVEMRAWSRNWSRAYGEQQ